MLLALLLAADVRIHAASPEAARALARERLSVYDVRGSDAYAVAPEETIQALRARGLLVERLEDVTRAGAYRTPEEINADILALAVPPFRLETLGASVNGVPILGLRTGSASQPAVRILGGHHGDEPPSFEFPLALARALSVNDVSVLIVPMVNPDGLRAHSRYNAHGVDINRNYSFEWVADEYAAGTAALSEPEARAIALDNEYHRYVASLTYHAGAENIGWPYNFRTGPFEGEPLLQAMADRYRGLVHGTFAMLRGADWYISHGDTNDYTFGFFGGLDFTVELSTTKAPSSFDYTTHLDAALDFVRQAASARVVSVTDASSAASVDTGANLANGLPAFVRTQTIVTTADPVRGAAQLKEGGDYALTYPGYDQSGPSTMTPTEASLKAREIFVPFAARHDDALAYPHGDFEALRAFRVGAADIVFECADGLCKAPAADRRPGHWDIIVKLRDGREGTVRNALLLRDLTGETPPDDAWLVARGGAGDNNAIDAVWVREGRLYTHTVSDPRGPLTFDPTTPNTGRSRGCASTLDGWSIAVLGLSWARWKKRKTSSVS